MGIRRLGYACVREGANTQTVKSCRLSNAKPPRLEELIDRNLAELESVLEFNRENRIGFFRIHSDTVPFASHPEVDFSWLDYARDKLSRLGSYLDEHDIRVSMHPGQYTVLNSEKDQVVKNAVDNLIYHAKFLDALQAGREAKIILHAGGVYGEREEAMRRLVGRVEKLPGFVQARLVLENDESSYDVSQVLKLSGETNLPVVFDRLHHELNSPRAGEPEEWLRRCFETWGEPDGPPIVHYSSASGKAGGHHADRIDPEEFKAFQSKTESLREFDVMLEAKAKELALLELRRNLGGASFA